MSTVKGSISSPRPLVVELERVLVRSDLLLESVLLLVKRHPLAALKVPRWLFRGRAFVASELAKRVSPDVSLLPYRDAVCDLLREQKQLGRRLILVSTNDERLAQKIASHIGLFDHVFGNRTGGATPRSIRDRLVEEFGEHGFDYVGSARRDPDVWSAARNGIVVGASHTGKADATQRADIERVIPDRGNSVLAYLHALRTHHWLKNTLIFVPLAAAHRLDEVAPVAHAFTAFASFCLMASALYVLNDLLDIEADRRHPRKRFRPMAAGDLSPSRGLAMIPVLLAGSLALALQLPLGFMGFWILYCAMTLAYSLGLKRIVLLDVIVLAGLYMLRILAGAAAVDIPVSRWLLGFSIFLFVSLAMLKRYTEIVTMRAVTGRPTAIRGYRSGDSGLLLALGGAAGYLSVVILALYVESATAERLYTRNELVWLVCPVLLYWVSYVWLMAHRNRMLYDPVVFAFRNRTSQILILIIAAMLIMAV